MVKMASYKVGNKFAIQMAQAIFYGKLMHHIEVIGCTNRYNIQRINNMIYSLGRTLLGNENIGRTNQWVLDKLKWLDYENLYKSSIYKTTHQLLNTYNQHYITSDLIQNRNIRNKSQNKLGPHANKIGMNEIEQATFVYQAKKIYNTLPKELTMIKKKNLFKKWLKKYMLNKQIRPIQSPEYDEPLVPDIINLNIIKDCENTVINSNPVPRAGTHN